MQNEVMSKNKEELVKDMFKVGAHFGYGRAWHHPSTALYVFGFKNRTAVIDLEKAADSLEEVKDFVRKLGSEGKPIMFVGTKSEARDAVRRGAAQINMPFVAERWIGGTFTNFSEIRKRIEKMQDLRAKDAKGELSIYTKKERGVIAKEIKDLERYFASLEEMTKLPAAIFVVDSKEEAISIAEAKQKNIPVIALSNSDCNIKGLEYTIVANDRAKASIAYFVNHIVEAYKEGKKMIPTPKVETPVVA
ncbi:MAG: 30S ribosomal protein S2 [bacterium]